MPEAKRDSYFFALRPAPGAAAELAELRDGAGGGGRPLRDELLHVTLCWFGYVERDDPWPLARARRAAGALAAPSFRILFDELVGAGRSLLVRGSERAAAPAAFQRRLLAFLGQEGLRPARGWCFDPHVTLRRGPNGHVRHRTVQVSWTADRFFLLRSEVGHGRHVVEGEWRLGG